MRRLFKLTTIALGEFYCIAEDPTTAENVLTNALQEGRLGQIQDRVVVKIELITWILDDATVQPNSINKQRCIIT
jgi:hypothetical protein